MTGEGSADEELAGPRTGGRWGRLAAVLVVAALLVLLVVKLRQDGVPSTTAAPTTAAPLSSPGPSGPVIPTFSAAHPEPGTGISQTFEVGAHRVRATLYGSAPVLIDPCYGKRCTSDFRLPGATRTAVRSAMPGCEPVADDVVRHRSGRALVVDRIVACVEPPVTLLVNIVRLHAPERTRPYLSGGRLVVGEHVHGSFTVQVFLQGGRGVLPKLAAAQSLAKDTRLLAGMDRSG